MTPDGKKVESAKEYVDGEAAVEIQKRFRAAMDAGLISAEEEKQSHFPH
jgi:hypothetical protein